MINNKDNLISNLISDLIEVGRKDSQEMEDHLENILDDYPDLNKNMTLKEIEVTIEGSLKLYQEDNFKYHFEKDMRHLGYYFVENIADTIIELLSATKDNKIGIVNFNKLYLIREEAKEELIDALKEKLEDSL